MLIDVHEGEEATMPRRPSGGSLLDRLVFHGLLVVIVLAPLPFGSSRPWSWSLLAVLVALLLIGWVISCIRPSVVLGGLPVPARLLRGEIILFLATVCWAWLQTGSSVPEAWIHPVWREAAAALDLSLAGSISVYPFATVTAIMRLLTYGGVFWLSLQFCRRSRYGWRLLHWQMTAGLIYALYGLFVYFSPMGSRFFRTILWFDKWAYHDDLTGTFVNRNHCATYLGLSLLVTLVLLVNALRQRLWELGYDRKNALRHLFQAILERGLFYIFNMMIMGTALLQTHSRMGVTATAMAFSATLLLVALAGLLPKRTGFTLVLGSGVLLLPVIFLSGGGLWHRLVSEQFDNRSALFSVVLEAFSASPWLGTGYGSFPVVFDLYRDLRLPEAVFYFDAHNTYLENGLELGLIGGGMLLVLMIALVFRHAVGLFRRERRQVFPLLALVASLQVGIHALVDFSVQIPAVAVLYAALLGAGTAQSWSSRVLLPPGQR